MVSTPENKKSRSGVLLHTPGRDIILQKKLQLIMLRGTTRIEYGL